jgi:hypothetical protein
MIRVCLAAVLVLVPMLARAQAQPAQVIAAAPPAPPAAGPPPSEVYTVPAPREQDAHDAVLPDRRVHAEVSVGVGTGGYRQGEATVEGPIGDTGYGSITVGGGQDPWRRY